MSACHVRAIQKMNGDFNDLTDFLIMQVIATDIGWNGEPCNTSYRTIADRTGVHYNTVASRVEKLAEQGHLITERRGKYIYYSLPFDCDNVKKLSQRPEGRYDNNDCDNEERLSQIEATLSQLSQQIITISEKIITMNQTEDVTKVSKERSKEGKEDGGSFFEVYRLYQNEIDSSISMVSAQLVEAAVTEYGPVAVEQAIKIAVQNNVRKWSYIDGVLKRQKAGGFSKNGSEPHVQQADDESGGFYA